MFSKPKFLLFKKISIKKMLSETKETKDKEEKKERKNEEDEEKDNLHLIT